MPKNTQSITYEYEFDGHTIALTRRHVGTAYARNGNVSNPTEYFVWDAEVDGMFFGGTYESRADAYEHARASVLGIDYYWHRNYPNRAKNVRNYRVVAEEMKNNYKGRTINV